MVKFSEEAKSLHASDIREILKVTENPEIISIASADVKSIKFVIDKKGIIRFKAIGFDGSDDKLVTELTTMIDMAKTM